MNNFKNNQRRNRFRSSGDRNFKKRNNNGHKLNGDFNNSEFKRKNPGRNNQNAAKLIEKYNDFSRILNSQEAAKIVNLETNNSLDKINQKSDEVITANGNKENNLEASD